MKHIALVISPLAKGAYFNDYLSVAQAELAMVAGIDDAQYLNEGGLELLQFHYDGDDQLLRRLSFVMAILEVRDGLYAPIAGDRGYALHSDFVFGSKFKGKTNELLTQLLINVGLATQTKPANKLKLLDPMAGRATTCLWGMRYGLNSKGIEVDPKAIADVQQILKKWCKVHRQKHRLDQGQGPKASSKQSGKYLQFDADNSKFKFVTGDSRELDQLLSNERFDLLLSDIPYGVQHATVEGTRNPLATLEECAPIWANALKPGGVIGIAFNTYIPRRSKLIKVFENQGLTALPYTAPHRMSESIVRDIALFKKEK